ncbi:efflux RND transporter periplasmic adaptor subunit [Fulvivirga sedimenti]|uniref:Efflux RND transporter periplasmic adaptor subunit n=1 Tax=Fulvivirga sedimenti TaxID=2879465 RepID=A0A9X1KYD6_9BACT|nr:efflux RND transporter periplasmic adaptor subunit [Fulvivirga sedimenti]MCA6074712.1 efflux RND transporter periplasmic adaptor subunit [Fulvivirga sedimenti]MCA6075889.1 efflux RND transporter periplasmic adaptor subunit [Fulvivirga sedimenti]MCA6077017.1 efflux RND transporter periplasmic adaptor subunit [Fulvivirga sedimenti]
MKYLPFLGLCCALIFSGCSKEKPTVSRSQGSSGGLAVEYFIARPTYFQSTVSTTAEIIPSEAVMLRAPVSGTVLAINFREGSYVQKGQSIIQLDDRAWKAQISGLAAELNRLKSDLERKRILLKVEGATQQEVDVIVAEMASIEAQMEELRVNIQLANVSAPFSGQVGLRDFSVGSYMGQGDEITTLADVQSLKVEFNLPERYQDEVSLNMDLSVIADTDTFPASIYAIDPIINPESRTLRARARISNQDKGSLRPGVFATVILPTQVSESALLVPTQVVVPEINVQTVYIARNGTAIRREVELAGRNSDMVQIVSGISPGDTVITTGLLQVKDGLPVSLVKGTNTLAP